MITPEKNNFTIYVTSLGCPKNRVNTEHMLGSLENNFKIVSDINNADIIFINTCAFIEPAVKESIRFILDSIEIKRSSKNDPCIIVAGCLVERYGKKELIKELPEVNFWLSSNIEEFNCAIASLFSAHSNKFNRIFTTPKSYCYLKISEGCNHNCTFCTIPSIKGKLSSCDIDLLTKEAELALEQGCKEIILVAQDATAWGKDKSSHLGILLKKLANLVNLQWLRLLYLYPESINDQLLYYFEKLNNPLLPYFDIPFQHSENKILNAMGRKLTSSPYEIVEKIRKRIVNPVLRSTFIVGFPGETDKDFECLCEFVKQAEFHHVGVFKFYAEDGTRAASLPDQIPDSVKEERQNELLKIQSRISTEILSGYIGRQMDVLVDMDDFQEWPGLYKGRVWFQAPDIDGMTYISGPDVKLGKIVNATIENSYTYDLVAIN